jgi:hypothetical protein
VPTKRFREPFGPKFTGLMSRVNDRVMDRSESPDLRGVITGDGGIMRQFGTVKSTSVTDHAGFSAGLVSASSTYIQVANGSVTFPSFGTKWTVLGAFNQATQATEMFVFSMVRTIGGTEYDVPGMAIQTDGTIDIKYRNSSETDLTISSTSTVSTGTNYYFMVRRLDDALELWVGQDDAPMSQWASGTGLGVTDVPADSAVHHFVVGARADAAPPTSGHFNGTIDGVTVLELAVGDAEFDMAYLEWPQPLMKRCLLMMPLEVAAGSEFVDLSAHSGDYTITHHASVTHQQTAICHSPTPVQMVAEVVKPDSRQYMAVIADGTFNATRIEA